MARLGRLRWFSQEQRRRHRRCCFDGVKAVVVVDIFAVQKARDDYQVIDFLQRLFCLQLSVLEALQTARLADFRLLQKCLQSELLEFEQKPTQRTIHTTFSN